MTLLKDIVKIEKGRKYNLLEENQQGAIRVFQANDFRNENKPLYTFDKDGVLAQEDDIMLVWDGSVGQMGFGRSGYVGSTMVKLKVKNKKQFSSFFIYRFLQTKSEYLKRKATGATIMHINRKSLEQLEIPELDFSDQLHIANLLSKAENLISLRKESIRLLDDFLKSTFLEMFGDPIANKKKWKSLQVSEYGESRLGKMLDGKKIIGNNLKPYLRNSNVLWFGFKLNDLLEMDFDEKDRIEFSLRHGDILMCEGGEIGRCAIWRGELEECYFQKAIHRIRLNKNIALPEYFVYMFWLYTMNGGLNKYMGAATISHLTGEKLKKMKLPIPPKELQTQFAKIVEKTEALKTQYQQSLQELDDLYGSLSQRAFRGEITIKDESLLMAAEPKSSYVAQSNIPDNKRGFAKQVLGGKIVSLFKDDNNFTHIKFQKLQYLAEQIAEENLLWNYYRQAAGPHDNKFKYSVIAKLNENKWFEERNYMFYPLQKANNVDRYYKNYFGNKSDRLNELFLLLKNATEKFCEAIATIYAVWNNQIILQLPYNKSEIKKAFFEWSNRKEIIFTEDEFEKALEWMKKHNIEPIGFGQLIKERTGKK
ncbi:MAG: restriction endonuclease subunit S [Bacteroidetes bacterium]|jgi:restriction endonuclease S subunit|nr:restriction endonuclease subunit S [Bacteroidota bacterium]